MNSYDYIVVGAETAGCVLANRLASHASLLLLEAGGPDSKREIRIPAVFPKLFKTEIDWAYFTRKAAWHCRHKNFFVLIF
jgi:choline dehydrogenase